MHKKPKFAPGGELWKDMRTAVNAYLALRHCQAARCKMTVEDMGYADIRRKVMLIIAWWLGSYIPLVFYASHWWGYVPAGISLMLASVAIGFNIAHDANHEALFRSRRVNRIFSFSLDFIGGSGWVWRTKHNKAHHTYPNVYGLDDDIENTPWVVLHPKQKWHWWIKYQHIYVWFLYCFTLIRWHLIGDWIMLFKRRITDYKLELSVWDALEFVVGKAVSYSWVFIIPIFVGGHSWLIVLIAYFALVMPAGFIMTLTFQLAHCGGGDFFDMDDVGPDEKLQNSFALHTLATTVDFCQGNKLLTAFLGGLNFQIEHHLFPHVPHVLYPRIAEIVKNVCREHGIPVSSDEELEAGEEAIPKDMVTA